MKFSLAASILFLASTVSEHFFPHLLEKKIIRIFSANESPASRQPTTVIALDQDLSQLHLDVLAASKLGNLRTLTVQPATASSPMEEIFNFAKVDSAAAARALGITAVSASRGTDGQGW
ncbi:hypothetical protein COCSADRAFT_358386 [Bipolaris sorokiniana ND90Pr]|uniref:Uncharacterized protein n=1 Tax=Cochliobolus sativus (strain ND90Pr / ATCC 201652) TaxID=665912 RepID=M2S927_COCSN|nr:uncharacterized protein COCSADRAFT_358386 [Bipolaris sorokiniana ND90Pr]EMD63853.1 hypothetical protein COCSADRAFT_358386 [Bipolaris sorokiniana ND90Pr]